MRPGMNTVPVNFENIDIRRVYDENTETWYFSVVDIRNMPMELQEEAFERGLIPFIPGRQSS